MTDFSQVDYFTDESLLADRLIADFIDRGRFEVLDDYANPYTLLSIADPLGVPEEPPAALRRPQRLDFPAV